MQRLFFGYLILLVGCGGETEGVQRLNPAWDGAVHLDGAVDARAGSSSDDRDDGVTAGQPSTLGQTACETRCLQGLLCGSLEGCNHNLRAGFVQRCRRVCQQDDARALFEGSGFEQCPEAGESSLAALGVADACPAMLTPCEMNTGGCEFGEICVAGACEAFVCADDALEEMADPMNSPPIMLADMDQHLQGLSICGGDVDEFEFMIPVGRNVFVDVAFAHGVGDLDIALVVETPEGPQVLAAESGDDNESLVIPAGNETRKALLTIFGFSGATNTYDLYLTFGVPLTACVRRADCELGFECRDSLCRSRPPCSRDDECGLGVCEMTSGLCRDCIRDVDCGARGVCTNHLCVECRGDEECDSGRLCSDDGLCQECLSDEDCAQGTCRDFVCRPEACNDSFEPNDSPGMARRIQTADAVSGALHCGDDDFYVFNVPPAAAVFVEVDFFLDEGDLDLELTGPDGRTVRSALRADGERLGVPAGIGGDFLARVFKASATAQSYGLRIQINPDFSPCNDDGECAAGQTCDRGAARCRDPGYCAENRDCLVAMPVCDNQANQCGPCDHDEYEPNDILAQGLPLESVPSTEVLNTCGGSDFFQFTTNAGESTTLDVSFEHMIGDLDVRLYDQAGVEIDRSVSVSDNERLTVMSETEQVFVVEVYGFGSVYNQYRISVSRD